MHETAVSLALIEQVERIAAERNAAIVSLIRVSIGPLSGVEPELLRRAFPLAAAGTIAEDANLELDITDVVVRCSQCGQESRVPPNRLLCSGCGDYRTNVVSGDEMILERLELDVSAQPRPLPH
ncbi:MAG: hydrogenase maturation nickel metallochaperone HypA [Woeseiaceae bacterium]|nr:hydrogenase maturation nickel metallochaperone HypA [Woeseiaceae bacterium]